MGQHDKPSGAGCEQQLWHLWEPPHFPAIGAGKAAGGVAGVRPRLDMQQERMRTIPHQYPCSGWCATPYIVSQLYTTCMSHQDPCALLEGPPHTTRPSTRGEKLCKDHELACGWETRKWSFAVAFTWLLTCEHVHTVICMSIVGGLILLCLVRRVLFHYYPGLIILSPTAMLLHRQRGAQGLLSYLQALRNPLLSVPAGASEPLNLEFPWFQSSRHHGTPVRDTFNLVLKLSFLLAGTAQAARNAQELAQQTSNMEAGCAAGNKRSSAVFLNPDSTYSYALKEEEPRSSEQNARNAQQPDNISTVVPQNAQIPVDGVPPLEEVSRTSSIPAQIIQMRGTGQG